MLNLILNLLWLLCGGLQMALSWFLGGAIMAVTIVGIPWARAAFNIGILSLWPFGMQVVDRRQLTGTVDIGTGAFGLLGNVFWFLFAGIWLAFGHLFWALVFAITLIGIPFAVQHFKLAGLSLTPIGKSIVQN